MKSLAEAFEHTLQDMYYAETALLKALPEAAKAAVNKDLKDAFKHHLEETKEQVKILDRVFKTIGKPAKGVKCEAMDGLLKEATGIIEEAEGKALDAALIGIAQAIEHYEIARYGTLREWARVLGHDEAHDLLSQILDVEKATNSKLTNLAVSEINAPTRKKAA